MKMQLIITADDPNDSKHLSAIAASVAAMLEEAGSASNTKIKTVNGGDADVIPLTKNKKAKEEIEEKGSTKRKPGRPPKPKAVEIDEDEEDEEIEDEDDADDESAEGSVDDFADDESDDDDDEEPVKPAKKAKASKKEKAAKEEKPKKKKEASVKFEDVQDAFREYASKNGRAKAAKILGQLGVKSTTDLVSEQYAKAMRLLSSSEDE